jgi:acetyltransferase
MNRDPYFGPVIAFGAGGVNVEIFKDSQFAIPPINRDIIYKLLSELRIFQLLLGHRGAAPSRIDSFIEMIEIICSLSLECTRISEIDLNPILLSPNEALIIDARIRVISRTEAQGDPSLVHRS